MMEAVLLIIYIVLSITCGAIAISLFMLSIKIFTADKDTWERNRKATGGFMNALRGTVPPSNDQNGNPLVRTGVATDIKTGELIATGKLRDDVIKDVLK